MFVTAILSDSERRLFCPSRTSKRGEKGYCVKEGGEEEGERERERALGMRLRHSPQHGG